MKTLLKISCWGMATILTFGMIALAIEHQMTVLIGVVDIWVVLQSAGTLIYIHQHDRLGKDQAKQAEHDRIKAEVLAELN